MMCSWQITFWSDGSTVMNKSSLILGGKVCIVLIGDMLQMIYFILDDQSFPKYLMILAS